MIYLIDTSTLKWAYLDGRQLSRRCKYLLSRANGRIFIAEITLLEIASAIASMVRDRKATAAEFAAADRQFWKDIASRKIQVLSLSANDLLECRQLIALIGLKNGRSLKAQDTMVAYSAKVLAQTRGERVTLLTCDERLQKAVANTPIFQSLVKAEYLAP